MDCIIVDFITWSDFHLRSSTLWRSPSCQQLPLCYALGDEHSAGFLCTHNKVLFDLLVENTVRVMISATWFCCVFFYGTSSSCRDVGLRQIDLRPSKSNWANSVPKAVVEKIIHRRCSWALWYYKCRRRSEDDAKFTPTGGQCRRFRGSEARVWKWPWLGFWVPIAWNIGEYVYISSFELFCCFCISVNFRGAFINCAYYTCSREL